MDLKSYFTTDEEFKELEDRDATTNVTGYIDAIIAPCEAGKDDELLFKFTLSNDSKRIEILIWGFALINKHLNGFISNRVVEINGAYCRAVAQSKAREIQNLVPFEIVVKEYTDISFLGYYKLKRPVGNEVQPVTFEDIHKVQGLIEISGYIRSKFFITHNRNGNMTYGVGAITDKTRKITVQIKQFLESKLELGDYVTIRGSVTGKDDLVTIMCNSMNDIKLNAEKKSLPLQEVRRGNRPVKRARMEQKKS